MNAYYDRSTIIPENTDTFYQSAPIQRPQKPKKAAGKIAAMALCFSLLGGAVGTGGTYLALRGSDSGSTGVVASSDSSLQSEEHNVVLTNTTVPEVVGEETEQKTGKMTASEVYKANVNSTVGITTSINTNYFGYKTTAAASGSGFIVSADGYIVTNHHVIDDANKITVTLYNGKTYEAELIGSDESNDVAVLKIDATGLTPVKLGSSSALSVGDDVAAIGNPLGELTFSLTAGVVSALDRSITAENKTTMQLIQTDAAINSGNSGGALFNMNGEVIGITNAKYSSSGSSSQASIDNIGFAIPIDSVKAIINSLISKGYVVKPYIGIGTINASAEKTQSEVTEGAAVKTVIEDSPAEKAGLKVNDIITEVNGKKIKSSGELVTLIKASSKDDKLVCKVYRDGQYIDITVTVGETGQEDKQSENKDSGSDKQDPQKQGRSGYGNYDQYEDFDEFSGLPF